MDNRVSANDIHCQSQPRQKDHTSHTSGTSTLALSELTIHNLEDGSRVVLEESRPIHICNVCARNSRIYFNLMPVSGVQKTKVQKTEGDKGGSSHYFTAEW